MMRGPDAAVLLGRALSRSAAHLGLEIALEEHQSTPWHSATFSGHRHAMTITASPGGTAASAWLAAISSLDVPLPGELLADLKVAQQVPGDGHCQARIEALTVECA